MAKQVLPPAPIWSDLRTFDARAWRGVVDCVIAGYPCQPFSVAGKRGGESDPRHLWPEVARIVDECQPAFGFFENVSGHLVLGFDTVAEDLERLGYRVAAGVFTASEVGASHQRERLFILAHSPRHDRNGLDRQRSSRGRVRKTSNHLAHRSLERLEGWSDARSGLEPRGNGLLSPGSGEPVGDSRECGLPGLAWRGAGSVPPNGHRGEIFPPGPGDIESWRRVLAEHPHLAPATQPRLRGVADGRPARVDRLRMLGNGVVPLQGAYAFLALASVLGFSKR